MKLLLKEQVINVFEILNETQTDRFISLDNGRVIDGLITPVLYDKKGLKKGDFIVELMPNFRVCMTKEQVDHLLMNVDVNFDVDQAQKQITDIQFLTTDCLTICILSVGKHLKFTGEFMHIQGLNLSPLERQDIAHNDAINHFIKYQTCRINEQLNHFEDTDNAV